MLQKLRSRARLVFRQHGLDVAILFRKHAPACFISMAVARAQQTRFSPNITVGVLRDMLVFAWTLKFSNPTSDVGRHNNRHLKIVP